MFLRLSLLHQLLFQEFSKITLLVFPEMKYLLLLFLLLRWHHLNSWKIQPSFKSSQRV